MRIRPDTITVDDQLRQAITSALELPRPATHTQLKDYLEGRIAGLIDEIVTEYGE